MKQIATPEDVKELPFDPTVLAQLHRELIELPFGSVDVAATFWKQETTCLFLIEPQDDLDQVFRSNPQLANTLTTPEFVLRLDSTWTIVLIITTDGGGGCYVAFPIGIDHRLDQLATSLD